jgi:putative heme transporter
MAEDELRRSGRTTLVEELPPEEPYVDATPDIEDEDMDERGMALFADRRRLVVLGLAFILLVGAIYVLLPKVIGIGDTLEKIDEANWAWAAVAVGFSVATYAAYVALFKGVLGVGGVRLEEFEQRLDFSASYQINMASLAASRIFSAGGAGGIAVTYWALRKAGMERRRAACRIVAFLALLYGIYLFALVIFGILLRTEVLPGSDPWGGTIVPAGVAGIALIVLSAFALIPEDVERRLMGIGGAFDRASNFAARIAKGPATVASGVRTAIAYLRSPRRGALALVGAVGFWATNIGVMWASFEAFGLDVSFGVLVQGFFVGMLGNLIPSPAGGVGSLDAAMIGSYALFGLPVETVIPAVLMFRTILFWLPIPPGIAAYFQLRKTVERWEQERSLAPAPATL